MSIILSSLSYYIVNLIKKLIIVLNLIFNLAVRKKTDKNKKQNGIVCGKGDPLRRSELRRPTFGTRHVKCR